MKELYINGTGYDMIQDTNVISTLKDSNYTNGEQYSYKNIFSSRTRNCHFEASDGITTTRIPQTGELTFNVKPTIDAAVILAETSDTPHESNQITTQPLQTNTGKNIHKRKKSRIL